MRGSQVAPGFRSTAGALATFPADEVDPSVPRCGEGCVCCSRMIFESQDGAFAVLGVAIMIAVGEPRLDLSQIARPDRLAAQRAAGLPARRPAIHQNEPHVAPPNAKQNTVSDGW